MAIMSHITFAPEQSECLLRVVEAAPRVCRRHQFFVWTQGDFQRWLPHKISVCGIYDREQRNLVFDIFNSVPVPDEVLAALKDLHSDLMRQAILTWNRSRQQASLLGLQPGGSVADVVRDTLVSLGYEAVMLHGMTRPGRPDEIESFYVFAQPGPMAPQTELLPAFDMLLPCLHSTYQRVYVTERHMVSNRATANGERGNYPRPIPITEREREILLWVRDGLSNQQISEKLGISALTVKNHVQKILRKLGAANRAQAVAKAMTMNALGAAHMQFGESHH